MAEINVLFPKSGKPLVMPDPEAVVTNRPFIFSIRNENPGIDIVGIEFAGGRKFFPGPGGGQAVCEKMLINDQAAIWAVAPQVGKPNTTKPAKYTVYGKSAAGKVVSSLDPKILPTDP